MSVLISVVVCTFNRSDLLANLLKGLCKQALEKAEYEVIVVDNNSQDDTRDVVRGFCKDCSNVRYCFEPQQGLSHARNLGWRMARGEYVAFIDDDCKAPEHWLSVAKEVIERVSPGVFGGPYFAFYNTPKPGWFKGAYGTHDQGNEARVLNAREFLDGGNVFFRRALLEALGGFDPSFGMSGHKIAYGEETVLLRHIRSTMPEQLIYYDPKLYVYHLVDGKKMSMRWIIPQRFASGFYSCRVFQDGAYAGIQGYQLLIRVFRILLALAIDFARGVLQRERKRYPYIQNYLYERTFSYIQVLGGLYSQYRSAVNKEQNVEHRCKVTN
jgi:glycosyltransferase involved in cell wall biosynthesis